MKKINILILLFFCQCANGQIDAFSKREIYRFFKNECYVHTSNLNADTKDSLFVKNDTIIVFNHFDPLYFAKGDKYIEIKCFNRKWYCLTEIEQKGDMFSSTIIRLYDDCVKIKLIRKFKGLFLKIYSDNGLNQLFRVVYISMRDRPWNVQESWQTSIPLPWNVQKIKRITLVRVV